MREEIYSLGDNDWEPPVLLCSTLDPCSSNTSMPHVYSSHNVAPQDQIHSKSQAKEKTVVGGVTNLGGGGGDQKRGLVKFRQEQRQQRLWKLVEHEFVARIRSEPSWRNVVEHTEELVREGKQTPRNAALHFFKIICREAPKQID